MYEKNNSLNEAIVKFANVLPLLAASFLFDVEDIKENKEILSQTLKGVLTKPKLQESATNKLVFKTVLLEITRKCNLKCAHCIRGKAQDVVSTKELIDKLLDQIHTVGHLALTGGEPFLEPDLIEYLVDGIIKRHINILDFSTVHNGTILDDRGDRCAKAFNRLGEYIYNYCWIGKYEHYKEDGIKPTTIEISHDDFHANNVPKAIEFYKKYEGKYLIVNDQAERPAGLKDKSGNVLKYKDLKKKGAWVKGDGNAKDLDYVTKAANGIRYKVNISNTNINEEDYCFVASSVEIGANGNIGNDCMVSFERFDNNNFGNIMDKPIIDLIVEWNKYNYLKNYEVNAYNHYEAKRNNPMQQRK